jgi:hypothetical protein
VFADEIGLLRLNVIRKEEEDLTVKGNLVSRRILWTFILDQPGSSKSTEEPERLLRPGNPVTSAELGNGLQRGKQRVGNV